MCGIVGIHNRFIDSENVSIALAKMNHSQFHRGPDGDGYYLDPSHGLAWQCEGFRLLILQLEYNLCILKTRDIQLFIMER